MFFRRDTKTKLEYALSFIQLIEESVQPYWHNKDYIPNDDIIQQLKKLEKASKNLQMFLEIIIHRLQKRMENKQENTQ